MNYELQQTKDGSHTLYIPEMDEHYHSIHGAINESLHVFIKNGVQACESSPLRILEVGFGTGLNAWLALIEAENTMRRTEYISYELYPLGKDVYEKLNYPAIHDINKEEAFRRIQDAPWGQVNQVSDNFSLLKKQDDITSCPLESEIDVIFFDAFAPGKQPEMWTLDVFSRMYVCLNKRGIIVTYCAKGDVRRTMQAAGFKMEKLQGPPGGKREMLRGLKY